MMPNKSIYRDADAAEINLYELNFARFFSIQTSENGWRRVVCELVRRAAKGTKELRLEDGTELPGEKTFPDYVVDLMDSYLAVLPDAKPHAYPAAEREQLMERHCRHTEDGGIDYDYYQDMTLDKAARSHQSCSTAPPATHRRFSPQRRLRSRRHLRGRFPGRLPPFRQPEPLFPPAPPVQPCRTRPALPQPSDRTGA